MASTGMSATTRTTSRDSPWRAIGVDWQELYGSWKSAGYDIDVCVMFGQTPPG